jgi:hypothetical protein
LPCRLVSHGATGSLTTRVTGSRARTSKESVEPSLVSLCETDEWIFVVVFFWVDLGGFGWTRACLHQPCRSLTHPVLICRSNLRAQDERARRRRWRRAGEQDVYRRHAHRLTIPISLLPASSSAYLSVAGASFVCGSPPCLVTSPSPVARRAHRLPAGDGPWSCHALISFSLSHRRALAWRFRRAPSVKLQSLVSTDRSSLV